MAQILNILRLVARGLQFIIALAILGLSSYVANWFNSETMSASPHQINFLIFLPVWSLIAIFYNELTPRFAKVLSNPYVSMLFEFTNLIWHIAGASALGHFLLRLSFCRGMVCRVAQADAFVAIAGIPLWLLTFGLLILDVFKLGYRRTHTASMRKPEMSGAA